MSNFLPALHKVYDLVYDSVYGFDKKLNYIAMNFSNSSKEKIMSKPNFSIPKIYTGGVSITDWKLLSKQEQQNALKKDWYVYYSFRSPETDKLVRQTPIKGYANSYKTKRERIMYLTVMRDALELLLKNGANPYTDNDFTYLYQNDGEKPAEKDSLKVEKEIKPKKIEVKENIIIDSNEKIVTIQEAFDTVLKLKKNVMNTTSFNSYQLRIHKFLNSLPNTSDDIQSITKKDVIQFLNTILQNTSPRNRNNYRTDLNSFFNELENNEYISNNFVTKINVLKAIPERNKTFSDKTQEDIYTFLENRNPTLLLFIKFISYNFLRPVEVCRLKVKDIDVNERKIYVRAKNQPVKIKIIPDILIKDLPDLKLLELENYLFTPYGFGLEWEAEENNRRDYFSKLFNKEVKKEFNLNQDYGLYSFRHTFITRLYRKLRENNPQHVAKSNLMLITGHSTMTALEKYLRDIDAELPTDYSNLLE